jgi:hypothetical protein
VGLGQLFDRLQRGVDRHRRERLEDRVCDQSLDPEGVSSSV